MLLQSSDMAMSPSCVFNMKVHVENIAKHEYSINMENEKLDDQDLNFKFIFPDKAYRVEF